MILALWSVGVISPADEKTKSLEQKKFLEAELGLAKTPATYLIIDFGAKSISIKSRGMILRSWNIRKAVFWGKKIPIQAYGLQKKSSWFPPKRKNIVPGKDAQGNLDLGVLELKEMPSSYRMTFPDGIRIKVHAKTKKFFGLIGSFGNAISRMVFLPLRALWFTMSKKPFTQVDIVLADEKDAKRLYWSFAEGESCIFFRPSE